MRICSLGKVQSIERKGKFIVIGFDSGVMAVIHLRMTGKLVWAAASEPRKPSGLRAEFCFADGGSLLFYSVRGFARLDFWNSGDKVPGIAKLGLDPFDKGLTADSLAAMMHSRKVAIKSFLLNQELIAGIGNIYACEILYRIGVHPKASAGSLSKKKVRELLAVMRKVLSKAIDCCGTSVSDFRNIDDKTGQFQNFLQVYQKKSCPKGHRLQKIDIAGRGTYFCPVCQSLEAKKASSQLVF